MSTSISAGGPTGSLKDGSTTDVSSNPFDTVFDGQDSEEEWWDEEESITGPERRTQCPKPSERSGLGITTKPVAQVSTRKFDSRSSVRKPTRDKSKGRQKRQNALAGIKVITNFQKPSITQGGRQHLHRQQSRKMPPMGRFVDLAALQALDPDSVDASGKFWKLRRGKTLKVPNATTEISLLAADEVSRSNNGNQGLSHRPLELDLSPSDRPIVIGLSIPSARITEHSMSPQTASSDTRTILNSYDHRSPDTPTIIITPAHAGSIWSALEDNNSAGYLPRPASSIYSQAPPNSRGFQTLNDTPPMPQMPSSVLENERQRIAAQKSYFSPDSEDGTMWSEEEVSAVDSKTRSRAFSTGTVFEEDESPILARAGRAVSISAGSRSFKHASINTIATRHRSKGWWNYITTPFLTRSNTVASTGVFENQNPPALPSLVTAAAKAAEAERDNRVWEKQFSPMTPATTTTINSEAWWDISAKEDKQKYPDFLVRSPDVQETRHKVQTSNGTIVLAEVAGIEAESASSSPEVDRSISKVSAQPSNTRAVPIVVESRAPETHSRFVQPQLEDLTRTTNQPTRRPTVLQIITPPAQIAVVPSPPPPYSPAPSTTNRPRYRAVLPPSQAQDAESSAEIPVEHSLQYPSSPGPISPGLQQVMTARGGIPMSDVPLTPPPGSRGVSSRYPELPSRQTPLPFFAPPPTEEISSKARKAELKRRRHEKEDAVAHRAGGWWRGRGCISNRGCYGRNGPEGRKKRRWYCGIAAGFIIMMILVITLATTLHRKTNTTIGPSQWVNITGFPPIYTGLSTVAAPVNIKQNTGCIFPSTLWSCDLPKELHATVAPNPSNQPNFLLQIQWDNSSVTNATFANVTNKSDLRSRGINNPVSAGRFIKQILLRTRDVVTFTPNPIPPADTEGFFLGNTTDGIVSPDKNGEPTPFYISFLSPTESGLTKRDLLERDTALFPNITSAIPKPSLDKDGTAAAANLLSLPSQQPVRLYDRDLPTEHYGFYTFFDKSIFLKSIKPLNDSNLSNGAVPDDENGGSTESEAKFRVTWAETRFLVQMWTRMNATARLNKATTSYSSNFTQLGTFPYPITITVDRHGGDPTRKMVYSYEMDDRRGIKADSGRLMGENRAFGGTIINPAARIFNNDSVDASLGGFDGGTSGCSCQWSNFQKVIPL